MNQVKCTFEDGRVFDDYCCAVANSTCLNLKARNYKKAIDKFVQVIDALDSNDTRLGVVYEQIADCFYKTEANGVRPLISNAIEYYTKGATLGDDNCNKKLGYIYTRCLQLTTSQLKIAEEVQGSIAKGIEYYTNSIDGYKDIAAMYMLGRGVKVDYDKAIEILLANSTPKNRPAILAYLYILKGNNQKASEMLHHTDFKKSPAYNLAAAILYDNGYYLNNHNEAVRKYRAKDINLSKISEAKDRIARNGFDKESERDMRYAEYINDEGKLIIPNKTAKELAFDYYAQVIKATKQSVTLNKRSQFEDIYFNEVNWGMLWFKNAINRYHKCQTISQPEGTRYNWNSRYFKVVDSYDKLVVEISNKKYVIDEDCEKSLSFSNKEQLTINNKLFDLVIDSREEAKIYYVACTGLDIDGVIGKDIIADLGYVYYKDSNEVDFQRLNIEKKAKKKKSA